VGHSVRRRERLGKWIGQGFLALNEHHVRFAFTRLILDIDDRRSAMSFVGLVYRLALLTPQVRISQIIVFYF